MSRFFLMLVAVLVIPFMSYAQDVDDIVNIIDEADHRSIAEMLKLQDAIPAAEKNCLRYKDKKECRCDNGYLYGEYDLLFSKLSERHPDWDQKTLKYNFYWEGVTYEGKTDMDTLMRYSDKFKVLDCSVDGDSKGKIEKK